MMSVDTLHDQATALIPPLREAFKAHREIHGEGPVTEHWLLAAIELKQRAPVAPAVFATLLHRCMAAGALKYKLSARGDGWLADVKALSRLEPDCPDCEGSGYVQTAVFNSYDDGVRDCKRCLGTGDNPEYQG